ncbi:MAG: T9SS type A sorting domain-containing protein [bacterium]
MIKRILGIFLFCCLILGISNAAPIKVLCWTADEGRTLNNKYKDVPGMMAEAIAKMVNSDPQGRFQVDWAHEDNAALQTANLAKYSVLMFQAYNDTNGQVGDLSHIEDLWKQGKLKIFGVHEAMRLKMPVMCGLIDGQKIEGTVGTNDLFNSEVPDHPLLKNVQIPFSLPLNEAYGDINLASGTQVLLRYGLFYLLISHVNPDHKGVSVYFQGGDPAQDPIFLDPIIPQVKQIFWNGIEWLNQQNVSIDKTTNNSKINIANYPNPFNPECYIPIEISNNKSQNIKIKIYNILGQVVREVISSNANNSVYWDGRDNLGKEVSSGMYFYETIVDNKTQNCKKMLMLK